MKIIVKFLIVFFLTFLSTPTIVSLVEKKVTISYSYDNSESDEFQKELKTDFIFASLPYPLFNVKKKLITILSENLNKHDAISKKIVKHDERNRLKKLMQTIKQPNFGVIIRTNAEGISVEELEKDLAELMAKWEIIYTQLKSAVPPQKLLGESERTLTLIRDLVNDFTFAKVDQVVAIYFEFIKENMAREEAPLVLEPFEKKFLELKDDLEILYENAELEIVKLDLLGVTEERKEVECGG